MSHINDSLSRAQTSGRLGDHRGIRYVTSSHEILCLIMMRLKIIIGNPRNLLEAVNSFSREVRITHEDYHLISFQRIRSVRRS